MSSHHRDLPAGSAGRAGARVLGHAVGTDRVRHSLLAVKLVEGGRVVLVVLVRRHIIVFQIGRRLDVGGRSFVQVLPAVSGEAR